MKSQSLNHMPSQSSSAAEARRLNRMIAATLLIAFASVLYAFYKGGLFNLLSS